MDRVQFTFTTVAAELQSHKISKRMKHDTHKFLENKAYDTKEVTLIKTLFTEYWPRQGVQIHHLYILQQICSPPVYQCF